MYALCMLPRVNEVLVTALHAGMGKQVRSAKISVPKLFELTTILVQSFVCF